MPIIAVTGIKGGVGCTALAAGLAGAWSRHGRTVLAMDLCRQNLLRLHFGQDWHEHDGWLARLAAGHDWIEAGWRTSEHLHFVPYGQLPRERSEPVAKLDERRWLADELARLALAGQYRILLDTPLQGRERIQALTAANHVLVVLPPEPLSCGLIEEVEAELLEHGVRPDRRLYVLNRFDPVRQLDRDVELLLREMLAERLAPLAVHRDEAVREALAMRLQLSDYAPFSQAADDCLQLATWLSIRIEAGVTPR